MPSATAPPPQRGSATRTLTVVGIVPAAGRGERPCVAAVRDEGFDGAVAAARVTDTVKEAGDDLRVERTLDRSRLWAIQTPQAFRRAVLARALDVDDAVLAQATD